MGVQTYKLNLAWDNSTSQTLTFNIPNDKPADYNMAFNLTNGNTINQTVTVGTRPNYYNMAVGLTNGKTIQVGTFRTPYYQITTMLFTFEVYDDTEEAEAILTNNSLVPVVCQFYYQNEGENAVKLGNEKTVYANGSMTASNRISSANLARMSVQIRTQDGYQSLSFAKEATNFKKILKPPENVYCTFYTTASVIEASYMNPNAISVTALIQIDGYDGETYSTHQQILGANNYGDWYEAITSSYPGGTIEVYFTASGYPDSSNVTKAVNFSDRLYPPSSIRTSLAESGGIYNLNITGWNYNNFDCVANYTIYGKTGGEVGGGTVNAPADYAFSVDTQLLSEDTGGSVWVYFTADGYEDSDGVQDSVSEAQ